MVCISLIYISPNDILIIIIIIIIMKNKNMYFNLIGKHQSPTIHSITVHYVFNNSIGSLVYSKVSF